MKIKLVKKHRECKRCCKNVEYYLVSRVESAKGMIEPDEYEVPLVLYSPQQKIHYYAANDKIISHLFKKIVFEKKINFGLHKHDVSGIYRNLLPSIIKLSDLPPDTEVINNTVCSCGYDVFSDDMWKDPKIDEIIVDARPILHTRINSLKEIKDIKLRRLFEDFDFEHWSRNRSESA